MLENNDYTRSDFYKFSRKARYFLPDNFKRIFYVQKIRSKLYKHSKEMGANITLFFFFFSKYCVLSRNRHTMVVIHLTKIILLLGD